MVSIHGEVMEICIDCGEKFSDMWLDERCVVCDFIFSENERLRRDLDEEISEDPRIQS